MISDIYALRNEETANKRNTIESIHKGFFTIFINNGIEKNNNDE